MDLIVIGGGPGGYVAAIRAAQLGLKVACVERGPSLGGTCLNIGCIPSKALLDSSELFAQIRHGAETHGIRVSNVDLDLAQMMARKERVVGGLTQGIEYLFRKNGVEWIRGSARLTDPEHVEIDDGSGSTQIREARRVLLATGSTPVPFPGVPFDEARVLSSTGALSLSEVPEHLVVLGGGVIGLELGSVWLRLGARVTVLELAPTILPGMDEEIVRAAEGLFREQGFVIRTGVRASAIESSEAGVRVLLEDGEAVGGDRCLVAIGRRPFTEGLGLEALGVRRDPRGAIVVDSRFHTGVGEVYAIGDVIGGDMLAHKAMAEGVAAAEQFAGHAGYVNYDAIASIVYTAPEIAVVGLTEEQARRDGRAIRVGKFPFSASGRARALGEPHGLVKVIADAQTDRLLGLHILGPRASELMGEGSLAIEFEASVQDLALASHAHPTLSEALKEAALAAAGHALHL